jgi:hypothetical protein
MGIAVIPRTDSGKQKVPGNRPALEVESRIGLVAVVIVIVPVTIGAPAVSIFIPPSVTVFPAPGTRFRQLMPILRGLRAVPAVVLGSFMKFVIRASDALLAVIVRAQRDGAGEEECGTQSRRGKNGAKTPRVQLQLHSFSLVAAAEMACGEQFGKKTGAYSMGVWGGREQVRIR